MIIQSFFILNCVLCSNAFNVLVYSPSLGGSHTNFMARLSDTLTDAGHNVTFLIPVTDEARKDQFGVKKTKDVIVVEQDEEMRHQNKPLDEDMAQYWTTDVDSSNAETIFAVFQDAMKLSCDNLMRNQKVFDELKSRNFDVGIFEPLSMCGLGYMYAIGIRKFVGASSYTFYDGAVDAIGEPIDFSYVPGMLGRSGDKMSFSERLENYRLSMATYKMQWGMWDEEEKAYKKFLGDGIPDWRDLMPSTSVFFTNSIPYVDFPRTVTHKTVPIGGISVDVQLIKSQKLSTEWSAILNERPHNMLISFGSMVRSMDMPKEWRKGLLEAIMSEPNVTFIWKYEDDNLVWAKKARNIHFSKWVPQTALLNDARLSAFLTHGGLGSTNELAYFGKPAVMIPVFADQDRNANMLARHGGVQVVHKSELRNSRTIENAIRSIIHDEQYRKSAQKLAYLLNNQPLKPKEQVVKYTEFVAKFGPFPEMDSYGRKLGFIERNMLDIYLIIGLYYFFIVSCIFIVLRILFRRISIKVIKKD